ncbi:MAG: LamG-like jellyroll fold domain-containing protein [Saprospiraceae bacterium]
MKKVITIVCILIGITPWILAQNALNFAGGNDFVQTNYNGVTGSANRTFEAWVFVNSSAPSSNLAILDYGTNAAGDRNTFAVSGARGLSFISGGTNANIGTSANAVPVNQWVHVAFVLNNGTGYMYVNGVQMGTGSLTSVSTPTNAQKVKIGNRVSGGSIPFNGSIDEVRIWDVARTASEIQANMNTELCQHANLQLYIKFNEGTAGASNTGITSAADDSGNGNNGVLNNFALTGATSNWVTGSGISAGTGGASTNFLQQDACNTFSLPGSSILYTASGTYTETFAGANSQGCDSIVVLTLSINNSPPTTDVQTACASYTWVDGNTYTSNNSSATVTLTNVAGCDSIVTLNLTIGNVTNTDTQTACSGYTWIDGNTYTSNNNTATHTLTTVGGCDSVITLNLTITSITSTDTQTACSGYTWIDGNTYTANNNTATHTLTTAAGCDSVITLDLTIDSVNTSVTQDGTLLTANEAGATYQWVECPGMTAISGATSQSYTATVNGNYAVIVTDNQCSETSTCYSVTTVGTTENEFDNSLLLFPNPTNGEFSIDMGQKYNKATVTIMDLTGRLILSNTYSNNQLLNLNLNAPSGIYVLIVQSEDKRAVIRLVKK